MKSLITSLGMLLATLHVWAQCTPNPAYTNSPAGVYPPPDTTGKPLPTAGIVGCLYSQLFTVIMDNTVYAISGLGDVTVTRLDVQSVTGMPPGVNYQCAPQTCSYAPSSSPDCAQLKGAPTGSGIFHPVLNALVDAALLPFYLPINDIAMALPDGSPEMGEYTIVVFPNDGLPCPVAATTCGAPGNVREPILTSSTVKLAWNAVSGATQYQIFGGVQGYPFKKKILPASVTSVTLTAPRVTPGQTYTWGVRAMCSGGWSSYGAPRIVTVPAAKDAVPTTHISTDMFSDDLLTYFEAFPNPASDQLTIVLDAQATNATLQITDIQGNIISQSAFSGSSYQVPLHNLPVGMYLANVVTPDGVFTKKFIKN